MTSNRPYFCRVEPEVFKSLYGIKEKKFITEGFSLVGNLNGSLWFVLFNCRNSYIDHGSSQNECVSKCRKLRLEKRLIIVCLHCSCYVDTIKTIYGSDSKELENFNRAIRSSPISCILPIIFEDKDKFYSCMNHCDFILHEACANVPCRKHHPLHAHPLTLKVVTNQYEYEDSQGYFKCDLCWRESCGFVYETTDQGGQGFRLDLQCASISEPFEYQGHEHPLFLALTPEEDRVAKCQICLKTYYDRNLNCIECDFVICFKCATLPYKTRYKHDKHLVTFQKEKEASDESGWCELCEKELVYSRGGGFYWCDDDFCVTTLHVDCLLGTNPYMRPGQTIMCIGKEIRILGNNTMSRPFCQLELYNQIL